MLTPTKYWRVAKTIAQLENIPAREFELPTALTQQSAPPTLGDGVILADYDSNEQTGLVRYVGIVKHRTLRCVEVDWVSVNIEIWVDTPAGRGNWAKKPGFKFADTKVAGYGLHQLFADAFPGLDARESLPNGAKALRATSRQSQSRSSLARERFEPAEIIGEPTTSPRGGYVYVLQSAYGYKVGRTRNIPSRMRAFGVKLPIMYTIPLCAWFDDHIEAEAAYHRMFADKHVNGEWFNLNEHDVATVRERQYQA
jgi:hypothetical protein